MKDTSGNNARARFAIFYYATPEMARIARARIQAPHQHSHQTFWRSSCHGFAPAQPMRKPTRCLSRIEYEARITLNEEPPPSPIKPLYQLLLNIIIMSGALSLLALVGGLVYGGMRLYRRRYGDLESQEAMTTLHLTGD